jgi:hypothetical protein
MGAFSRQNRGVPVAILFLLPALLFWLRGTMAHPLLVQTIITYTIDRTAVPPLYYNDLTLNVYVGAVISLEVSAGGQPLTYQYNPASGELSFTTSAGLVTVTLTHEEPLAGDAGSFTRAPLKDNRKWAWSHGLDDNVYVRPAMQVLEARGWRGTLFLIGKDIEDERDEDWVIDAIAIRQLVAEGWSFGNHTWDHVCDPATLSDPVFVRATILNGYYRLLGIIQSSAVPDYRIVSFASPCFRHEYHPVILQMVADAETDVLFDEAGNDYRLVVDPGASDYSGGGKTAVAFTPTRPIGRDIKLELGAGGIAGAKAEMDWMAAHAAPDRHFWYNTLTHGHHEQALSQLVAHVYYHYGPGGSNEAWVAPSDEIYSYLLVRDRSEISYTVEIVTPPTATPTATATATPIATTTATVTPGATPTLLPTATAAPTLTPNPSATATPTAAAAHMTFLPLLLNQ